MFANGQFEGTQIADYQRGGLITIPNFVTQPYFLTAKAGCPIIDRPVCGVDGKTYQNECFQKLAGVQKAYEGWCIGGSAKDSSAPPKEVDPLAENEFTGFLRFGTPYTGCPCNDYYYPVCSTGGVTYSNLCRAKCNGATAVQVGECYNFYYKPVPNTLCKCAWTQELVCAANGVTYENTCVMICAGASFFGIGQCEAPCKCPFVYKPVCGIDGKNYLNDCEITCKKVKKAFNGRCETGAIQKCIYCIGDVSKVCGKDGKTYDNICYLKCNQVDINYDGACLPPSPDGVCRCANIFLPVCGTDGITYNNECLAKCNNREIAYNGACKPKEHKHHRKDTGHQIDNCLQQCAKHGSAPVCGTDGRTYGNECATTCNSVLIVKVVHPKPCKLVIYDHCPCNTEMKPVCGVDGKTYLNICTIQCIGINKAWDGPCGVIGNYGYIMSEYYTGATGAGPVNAPAIKERDNWAWRDNKSRRDDRNEKRDSSDHDEKSLKSKRNDDSHHSNDNDSNHESKKEENSHHSDKNDDGQWQTKIIHVTLAGDKNQDKREESHKGKRARKQVTKKITKVGGAK